MAIRQAQKTSLKLFFAVLAAILLIAAALTLPTGCSTYGHKEDATETEDPGVGGFIRGDACVPGTCCNHSSCNPACADGYVCIAGSCIDVITVCKTQ